ncbi:MFS general substrate transporter [Sistotremastrum niveocremeum HHB9708]|uniref:MFS general substrate transporter n=1 Tax=Sistotremastrum niveocremeum HHB9708 TaxID=1314777 RepID=A0A164MSU0_9AGAM|nr:MFS general substrate transporter [Sistotremastrum niveocremeum HHB9708]
MSSSTNDDLNERTALLTKTDVPVLYHASDAQSQPTVNAIETTIGRDDIGAEAEAGSSGSRTPRAIADANEQAPGKSKPLSSLHIALLLSPLTIGIFLAAMDGTIVASSYASIGSELNQLQNTSWIATAYMVTLTSFQPLYGKLSDIFGRKYCMLVAYAIFALGCLFCGLAQNMTQLIAARALAGLGGGGMTTIVSIIMSDIIPLRQRGTWQGIGNVVFAAGSAAGAPLGGIFADSISWRWAFLFQVPLNLIAFGAVSFLLTNTTPVKAVPSTMLEKIKRIDFLGAVVLVAAVFFILLGLEQSANLSLHLGPIPLPPILLITSLLLFVLFILIERRPPLHALPFAPPHILFSPTLLASYLCNFFAFASVLCTIFHISLYFQAGLGWSASQAGVQLLPSIVGGVSGSLVGGVIMGRTGRYWWLTIGAYALQTLGTGLQSLVTGTLTTSTLGVSLGLLFGSFGNGIGVTTTLIALIANVSAEDQAMATAASYLFRALGSVIGISAGSALVQLRLGGLLYARLGDLGGDRSVDEVCCHCVLILSSKSIIVLPYALALSPLSLASCPCFAGT